MNKYEGMFILPNSLNDEAVAKTLERLQGEITKAGGVIRNSETLGRRQFSRRLHKHDSGCYVRLRFELDPSAVAGLQVRLKLIEEIFRTQIVRAPAVVPVPEPAKEPVKAEEPSNA